MPAFETVLRHYPVPLKDLNIATGTWTYTYSSGLVYMLKTATDETSTITFILPIPRKASDLGVKIKKVLIPLRVITADLDAAPACKIYRIDLDAVVAGATGDAAAVELDTTDNGVVTADANDRMLSIDVDDPAFDFDTEENCVYVCEVALNCGATTVARIYPPIVEVEELV